MFWHIKNCFKRCFFASFFSFITVFFLLSGCGTEYEQLKVDFFAKRYLETIEHAVKGAKNPKFKQGIYTFCTHYGPKVYQAAFEQIARECLNSQSPLGLRHLDRLQSAIAEGITISLPVEGASDFYTKCVTLRQFALRDFLATQRSLGSEAMHQKKFKKAVQHFKYYLEFQPADTDVQLLLSESQKKAETHLILTRLYTPSDTIGNTIRKELVFLKKNKDLPISLKTITRIEGLPINDMVYEEIFSYFKQQQNPFIVLHREDDVTAPSSSIVINGFLESKVIDTENTPIRSLEKAELRYLYEENNIQRWGYDTFEFPVYTITYAVSLDAHFQTDSGLSWSSDGEHTELRRYRANDVFWARPFNVTQIEYPNSYLALSNALIPIDRSYTCRAAIQNLSHNVVKKIIEEFN